MVITCEVQADTRAWRERTPQPRAGAAMGVETGAGFAASQWACGLACVGSKFRYCGAPPAGRTLRRPRRGLGRLRGRAGRSRAGRGGDPGRLLQLPAAGLAALQPPPPAPSAPRAPRSARPRRGHTLSSPRPLGPALCGARGRARPPYLWLRVALGSEVGAARGPGRSESPRTRRAGGSTPAVPRSGAAGFGWAFMVTEGDEGRSGTRHFCEGSCFRGVESSYAGLLQRGLFVVCTFVQPVVSGGRLSSACLVVPRRPGAALPCQHVPAVLPKASSLADIPELRLFCGCYSADCRYLCFADILFWFWFLRLTCFFFITETLR